MSNLIDTHVNYYFVPLGRERGGYLDLLGLPPDTTENEAKPAEVTYQKNIDKEFKSNRKELKAKLEIGQITSEEFEAQVSVLEQQKTQKLTELSKLRETFNAMLAKRRELSKKGLKDESVSWLEMYQLFGDDLESFWRFVLRCRPLPQVDAQILNEMEEHWLHATRRGNQQSAFSQLPSRTFNRVAPITLSMLMALITEGDLISLLSADNLWAKLPFTNREYWHAKMSAWSTELVELGPKLSHHLINEAVSFEFSSLCKPFPLMVESLNKEEIEDVSRLPKRAADFTTPPLNLGALLAALLAKGAVVTEADEVSEAERQPRQSPPTQQGNLPDKQEEVPLDINELMGLIEFLARTQNQDQP